MGGQQRLGGRRRRDGLPALDQRNDLVSFTAEIAVGAERVIPPALRTAHSKGARQRAK